MESLQSGYKPSLMMIFACLGDIHAERHQKTNQKADLDEALWATRFALSISSADNPINTILLNNLANGLWRRYRSTGHEDDLYQALFYGLQASEALSQEKDSDQAAVSGALGAIRASLYDCRGDFQDLQEAIAITRRSIDITTRWAEPASMILLNNLGAYLWMQYRLTGRREDLDESVVTFVKALRCLTNNTVDRVTCLINSGHVLAQRYHHTSQLEDLSCALETAQEAMHLDPQNGDLAILLKRLDRFLDRRHKPEFPVHWPRTHWNAKLESGNLLVLLAIFILTVAIYFYHPRTEILFSMVAFPCGIICHWMISRRPIAKQRVSMKDTFASFSSMKDHLGSLCGPHEYRPKLLAVPLIQVPFTSSLRGIQSSGFSAYSSLLYKRRRSMHPVNSENLIENGPSSIGDHSGRDVKVYKGRYRGPRLKSPPLEGHNGIMMPTIAATTPDVCMKSESPKLSHPVMQNEIPQVEEELSRNEVGSSLKQRENHVTPVLPNDSSIQRVAAGYSRHGSSKPSRDEGTDIESSNKHQSTLSTDEQYPESSTSPSSYSRPATLQDTRPVEYVSSPLVPSQKLWAQPESEYSEHKIWEEQDYTLDETEKEQVCVITQGHTKLKMGTNSGLAMGNITSTRTEVVGCVNSGEAQPRRHNFYHKKKFCTARPDNSQSGIVLQEEEARIVPEVTDLEGSFSADVSVHDVKVQIQAPLTSIVEDLVYSQVPRVVEVDDESPVFAEQEDFDMDLVDRLARDYLQSSTL